MINCIIVDDEPLAREVIRIFISRIPGWIIAKECINAMEAYEALVNHPVQVMFLDVQMPLILGVDFFRSLKDPPKVIFTTAHSSFAVEGFELSAVDYLLKPVTFERFKQAIVKAEQQLSLPVTVSPELPVTPIAAAHEDFIFIKQDSRLVKVAFEDILFIEAKKDFTLIQLKDKKMLAGFHLKMLEDMLPVTRFMRVHRSFIVRLNAIEALSGNIIEIKSFRIPVSTANKSALTAALKI